MYITHYGRLFSIQSWLMLRPERIRSGYLGKGSGAKWCRRREHHVKRCGAGRELASLAPVAELSRTRDEVRSEKRGSCCVTQSLA